MAANDTQVGGKHYKVPGLPEHWDLAVMYHWDPFQYQITKYVMRWKDKNGLQDLQKAAHFLQKYMEVSAHYDKPVTTTIPNNKALGAPDFLQYVKPTGWVGFTFEGADAEGFHYRCEKCRERLPGIKQFRPPWDIHDATKCKSATDLSQPPEEQLPLAERLLRATE